MDSPICGACDLAAQIENARLKIQIERLKQRLAIAKAIAENIKCDAENRMAGGNLPRAAFGFLRGAYISSDKISKSLG